MPDVFEFTGPNPPGLDVLSAHETVLWKHPQHGWLRASKNGSFTPITEADAVRLKGPAPATPPTTMPGAPVVGAPTTETVPAVMPGAVGAGSVRANAGAPGSNLARGEEFARARREVSHQETLDRAKFAPQERADPMAGFGLMERSEVAKLVREGATQEQAVEVVRAKMKPPAAVQAEGLRQ